MADRLTQLQDAVNSQADNFCNAIGILQQVSVPGSKLSATSQETNEHTQLFAAMIARTARDIEVLIESLPSEESTPELQAAGLARLETESELAGEDLAETVKQGERLLSSIQAALHDISNKQLEMDKIAAEEFISAHTTASTL